MNICLLTVPVSRRSVSLSNLPASGRDPHAASFSHLRPPETCDPLQQRTALLRKNASKPGASAAPWLVTVVRLKKNAHSMTTTKCDQVSPVSQVLIKAGVSYLHVEMPPVLLALPRPCQSEAWHPSELWIKEQVTGVINLPLLR